MKRIVEYENLLARCEQDFEKLKSFNAELEKMEKNIQKLTTYYQKHYDKDVKKYRDSSTRYRVLDEDSIWNLINDRYREVLKTLKVIVKNIS